MDGTADRESLDNCGLDKQNDVGVRTVTLIEPLVGVLGLVSLED
jgi:hypothetical protein